MSLSRAFALQFYYAPPAPDQARGGLQPRPASAHWLVRFGCLAIPALFSTQVWCLSNCAPPPERARCRLLEADGLLGAGDHRDRVGGEGRMQADTAHVGAGAQRGTTRLGNPNATSHATPKPKPKPNPNRYPNRNRNPNPNPNPNPNRDQASPRGATTSPGSAAGGRGTCRAAAGTARGRGLLVLRLLVLRLVVGGAGGPSGRVRVGQRRARPGGSRQLGCGGGDV